jgi:hypothetical protein
MGQARQKQTRLQQMQTKLLWCIYCGGTTHGTNVDHMPPTGVFDLRKRLAGMEYLYAVKPGTLAITQEIRNCIAGVGRNVPKVLSEMHVEKDLRGVRYDAHTALPDASAVLSTGPTASSYLTAFGARVALALHFELTREILPAAGGVFVRWLSNHAIVDNEIPEDFLAMLESPQSLKQGRLTLEDQFQYSSLAEGVDRSAHFATFRVSFAIQAFVVRDFTEMEHIVKDFPDKVFRPGFLKVWSP